MLLHDLCGCYPSRKNTSKWPRLCPAQDEFLVQSALVQRRSAPAAEEEQQPAAGRLSGHLAWTFFCTAQIGRNLIEESEGTLRFRGPSNLLLCRFLPQVGVMLITMFGGFWHILIVLGSSPKLGTQNNLYFKQTQTLRIPDLFQIVKQIHKFWSQKQPLMDHWWLYIVTTGPKERVLLTVAVTSTNYVAEITGLHRRPFRPRRLKVEVGLWDSVLGGVWYGKCQQKVGICVKCWKTSINLSP